jgi:3-oxoacyl-[acyl-carrier protein] reductase
MIDTGLKDKVVLITGANNPLGIGAATARAFAREGARVAITYLRLPPEPHGFLANEAQQATAPGLAYYHGQRMKTADNLLGTIRTGGGQAEALEMDITDSTNIPQLYDWAEKVLGPVDVLVNNAAHYEASDTIFTITPEALSQTFEVNVYAAVLLTAEFVRRYQKRGGQWGRVINLSTDAAQVFAGQIAYGASKATMEAFTRSMAIELGPLGITVNAVAPGPVQTGYISADFEATLTHQIPLRRIGQPEDIADAIVFLASGHSRWLTGQVLKVSGGHAL